MVSVLNNDGTPSTIPVVTELKALLEAMFASMPSLEFHAHRTKGQETERVICQITVYDGEQHLGRIAYAEQYTRSGYKDVYHIQSRKIKKERGTPHVKTTGNFKAALKIAKAVFVKDSESVRGPRIFSKLKSEYSSLLWQANSSIQSLCNPISGMAVEYLLSVVDGAPLPIDHKIYNLVHSDAFKQARDTHRIAKAVQQTIQMDSGAVVYMDRLQRLSFYDADSEKICKLESTYDLPKNYQEKYTMLKVMELNQPVEHVGVKMEFEVDDVKRTYFYLCPGDTVVTH